LQSFDLILEFSKEEDYNKIIKACIPTINILLCSDLNNKRILLETVHNILYDLDLNEDNKLKLSNAISNYFKNHYVKDEIKFESNYLFNKYIGKLGLNCQ
jgi:hypothetical protein